MGRACGNTLRSGRFNAKAIHWRMAQLCQSRAA